jgi:hypothetical protein
LQYLICSFLNAADERIKRVQAEDQAQAAAQRLSVAQTQFSEYLSERAATEETLATQAERLEELIKNAATSDPASLATALAAEIAKLKEGLSAAALEVKSAAQQMQAENERAIAKRTSDQANLQNISKDVEMKRAREDGEDSGSLLEGQEDENGNGGADGVAAAAVNDDIEFSDAVDTINGGNNHSKVSTAAAVVESHDSFRERAKYIPLRLESGERRILRLLEGALNVSEYTDKVDILSYRNKSARVHAQIKDLCAILCGLAVAQDFRAGQKLISDRNFDELSAFFQNCFEIGRRHKVMNPEKMRDTYGKLCYMLMDSSEPEMIELLGFRCVRPLQTVSLLLEEGDAAAMLDDPLMAVATAEISSSGRPRAAVQKDIRAKERARDILARKYRTKDLDEEDLLRCLYSISDNNSFLAFSRDPVDRMIQYLEHYFQPDSYESPDLSLAIQGGSKGARLTHSHAKQYTYVLQSMTLWREISHEMFKLWCLAENDMMSERNYYRLQNTGQGLQRVQSAPSVGRAMQAILSRCQRRLGSWVGSSVVHLGDHNVPNALMFIDKYTQVPRILNPLVLVLDEIPKLAAKDAAIAKFLNATFGGVEECRKEILADFFKHAFDGSGADNFFDAGSCVDGRLTSAWQWTSKIEKKRYYSVFKLAGFTGFDGDFKG